MKKRNTKKNKEFCLETTLFNDDWLFDTDMVSIKAEEYKRLIFFHNAGRFPRNKSDNEMFTHPLNETFKDKLLTQEMELLTINEENIINPIEKEFFKRLKLLGL